LYLSLETDFSPPLGALLLLFCTQLICLAKSMHYGDALNTIINERNANAALQQEKIDASFVTLNALPV